MAGLLLGTEQVLDPSASLSFMPDDSNHHISSAWRYWKSLGPKFSGSGRARACARRLGISNCLSTVFVKQRIIRQYLDDFSAAHSIYYFTKRPVILLTPAPADILRSFASALGGWNAIGPGSFRINLLILMAHASYVFLGFARCLNGLSKTGMVVARMFFLRLKGLDSNVMGSTFIFSGHSGAGDSDPGKLSEVNFWKEVVGAAEANGEGRFSVLILNDSGMLTQTLSDGVFASSDIFTAGIHGSVKLCLSLLVTAVRLFVDAIKDGDFGGAADDMLCALAAGLLREFGPKRLITTNTLLRGCYLTEGASAAGIESAVLYYSSNNSQIPSSKDPFPEENPALTLRSGDIHFSWNLRMSQWLIHKIGVSPNRLLLTGPVMFASVSPFLIEKTFLKSGRRVNIGLFDVTPVSELQAFRSGQGRGVYRREWCLAFFKDVVDACQNVFGDDFILLLKFKRMLNPQSHDMEYIQELNKVLEPLRDRVVRLDPETNPWKVLSECDVTIGMPFTSMVEAGLWMGKLGCFYAPGFLPRDEHSQGVDCLATLSELKVWLEQVRNAGVSDSTSNRNAHRKSSPAVLARALLMKVGIANEFSANHRW